MNNFKLRDSKTFKEVNKLLDEIPPNKHKNLKIIGSYLFTEKWKDIDFVCNDVETGYLLDQAGKKLGIQIQLVFATDDEFSNFEGYLTFFNTAVCYDCETKEFNESDGFKLYKDSKILKINNKTLYKFKNSRVLFREIEKMKMRGYTIWKNLQKYG